MPVVPKVYFSYAWGDDETPGGKLRAEAADTLYVYLKEKETRGEVEVVIDRERMSYKSSIRKFTEAYGHAEAIIILIISEKYLQSEYCMGEVVQILSNKDYQERIFPVVLPDANLRDPVRLANYQAYWVKRTRELSQAIKEIGRLEFTRPLNEILDDLAEVVRIISKFTTEIRDLISVSPPDYSPLLAALDKRLAAGPPSQPGPPPQPPEKINYRSLPDYHAYTCDRVDQRDHFLLNHYTNDQQKICWYYLYGDSLQAHESLHQRLGKELAGDFENWEDPERRPDARVHFEFIKPRVSKQPIINRIEVVRSLLANFSLDTGNRSLLQTATVAELLKSPKLKDYTADDHVFILITMDDANWDKVVTPQSVDAIVSSFLACELPQQAPSFYFFFGIEYTKDNSFRRREEVDEVIGNRKSGEVLPELQPVSAADITEWFSRYRTVMVSPGKLPQDMTREVFGDADVLDMKIVERKLLELINHQAKEFAQAKETHPR